jgi:hypothetical protein
MALRSGEPFGGSYAVCAFTAVIATPIAIAAAISLLFWKRLAKEDFIDPIIDLLNNSTLVESFMPVPFLRLGLVGLGRAIEPLVPISF